MKYERIVKARFIERENRFVARVSLPVETDEDGRRDDHEDGRRDDHENGHRDDHNRETRVHVKNTGRCRELLVPGATVYLEDSFGNDRESRKAGTKRKYRYSLVAVEKKINTKDSLLINMDSQAPNKVVEEALRSGRLMLPGQGKRDLIIRPETTFGSSRFDFYVEFQQGEQADSHEKGTSSSEGKAHAAFIEVKGVTLEDGGIARFPDAPTTRGVKHVQELEKAAAEGFDAHIIFVIQMKGMKCFEPNDDTHREFGEALRHAKANGVSISAYDCIITEDGMELDEAVPVSLGT